MLLPALDAEQSEHLLTELLTAIAKPIAFGSESVSISATGGMAAVTPNDPQRHLRQANEALRDAKRQGVSYTIVKPNDSE